MFITDEMHTQEFLDDSAGRNFYRNSRILTKKDIDHFKIDNKIFVRRWYGGAWHLDGPHRIVGHRIVLKSGQVWQPNFDRLLQQQFDNDNINILKIIVQLSSRHGLCYRLHTEDDYELGSMHIKSGEECYCRCYGLDYILRPQTPPVKQMLTSVNLHRLAYGESVLRPGEVEEDLLAKMYKDLW